MNERARASASSFSPGVPAISTLVEEVTQIVARGELEQVEFKTSTGQRTEAAKTVCGMLNRSGGFLLFGVADDGKMVGQQVTASTLEDIVRELRRIEPQPYLTPETIDLLSGRSLILVRIPRGGAPYLYDRRAYVQRSILTALADGGPASSVTLQERVPGGLSNTTILNNLRHLYTLGLVAKTGVTRGSVWRLN